MHLQPRQRLVKSGMNMSKGIKNFSRIFGMLITFFRSFYLVEQSAMRDLEKSCFWRITRNECWIFLAAFICRAFSLAC